MSDEGNAVQDSEPLLTRMCPKCGKKLLSLTYDKNSDCLIERCLTNHCSYSERYKDRRKRTLPVIFDRRVL